MNSLKTNSSNCKTSKSKRPKRLDAFFLKRSWYADYFRTTDDYDFNFFHFLRDFLFCHRLRFIVYFRWAQNTRFQIVRLWLKFKLFRYSRKFGIEIATEANIGKGFCLIHPYNITVSQYAQIGTNVTMMKGSTVGIDKKGAPKIGNNVYIGLNSTVIGNIHIGNNVLIAPNTMVNIDIPSNSIVIGSPCNVIPKENPTQPYIWKYIENID